jgi:hypothetical protein
MPRVHQMRTDLAQYYNSRKPSLRLQYITGLDEKVNFQMNGTDLLLRDLNVFCTTKTNSRSIMEQLKQLAINNNTSGASIYDLGNIMKSESIAELTGVLKASEEKVNKQRQEEQQHQQQMQQEQLASEEKQKQMDLQFKGDQADKDRQNSILIAEIRAAGYGSMMDLNENKMSDYQDALSKIQEQRNYQDQTNLKRESEINKRQHDSAKLDVEKQKLQVQQEIANTQLQIARENKNKYDSGKKDNKKK